MPEGSRRLLFQVFLWEEPWREEMQTENPVWHEREGRNSFWTVFSCRKSQTYKINRMNIQNKQNEPHVPSSHPPAPTISNILSFLFHLYSSLILHFPHSTIVVKGAYTQMHWQLSSMILTHRHTLVIHTLHKTEHCPSPRKLSWLLSQVISAPLRGCDFFSTLDYFCLFYLSPYKGNHTVYTLCSMLQKKYYAGRVHSAWYHWWHSSMLFHVPVICPFSCWVVLHENTYFLISFWTGHSSGF